MGTSPVAARKRSIQRQAKRVKAYFDAIRVACVHDDDATLEAIVTGQYAPAPYEITWQYAEEECVRLLRQASPGVYTAAKCLRLCAVRNAAPSGLLN